MMRVRLLLVIMLMLGNCSNKVYSAQNVSKGSRYEDALAEFIGASHLWIGKPLDERLAGLKKNDAVCYVIFEEQWRMSGSVYVVKVDQGYIVDVKEYMRDRTSKSVEVQDFVAYCKRPAMMAYKQKTYLNIPESVVLPAALSNEPIGFLLLGSLYRLSVDMKSELPNEKLRAKILFARGVPVVIAGLQISDVLSTDKIMKVLHEREQKKRDWQWKREHDKMVKRVPRRPPVVYGDVDKIVRKADGTFIIPREPPETTRTITWTETVWAEGYGTTSTGEGVTVRIPVGERECQRTKKITSLFDYEDLKKRLEAYEEVVAQVKNDKPPKVDLDEVREIFSKMSKVSFAVE